MIHRRNYNRLWHSLQKKEVSILIGARQVGKTTLLIQVIDDLKKNGEKTLFLNLDIEADAKHFESQQLLLSRIQLEFGSQRGYVFIDEIQQKEDAGRFLKGIYDMNTPYKFVVTGSGSLELKQKIGESLMGRKHLMEMYSVDFKEYLDYKTDYKYSDRLSDYCQIESDQVHIFLNEYLQFGGYPKAITSDGMAAKRDVLGEIYRSYLTKDISFLLGVRSTDKFTKLIELLAVQSGCVLNYAQLASDCNLTVETLKNYLWYAQQTYMIQEVLPFYTKAKKEITKSPSFYFNDVGMCRFAQGNFGSDVSSNDGFLFQSFVFQLLRDRYKDEKLNFWRTKDKAEVDFIVHENGKPIPVEVKHSHLKKTNITRSFRSFINKYQPSKAFVINMSMETTLLINETEVQFLPYYKFID